MAINVWTHPLIVMQLCSKYGMPMSKRKEDMTQTQSHEVMVHQYTNVPNVVCQYQRTKKFMQAGHKSAQRVIPVNST